MSFIRVLSRQFCAAALALAAASGIAQTTPSAQLAPAKPDASAPVPATPDSVAAPVSEAARDVLARVRPAIIQIKGFFGANTSQAFHGTGFAVAPGGVFVTNYHVVAQEVMYPDKYRLEYRAPDGATGTLAVLAIDVRHDLAVVRAASFTPQPLKLDSTVPAKGSRAFSIGFPLDVGLTITEGVSNGRVEDSFDPRIHYSGAINGGMSGGPALNAGGQVIGVNVSGYRFEQLVSFLVPALHAQALLERALKQPELPANLRKDAAAQLRAHAADLLSALEGNMSTALAAGYALPAKLTPFVDCSASGEPAPESSVQTVNISCTAKAGLYVQQGLYTGDLKYSHYVLTTDKLDAWRFARRLSSFSPAMGNYGARKNVGPFACENGAIKLHGFDASLTVCSRGYRKLDGLYDITARVVSLNQPHHGFVSHLDMFGVEFEGGMRFVKRYVEAMQWTQ